MTGVASDKQGGVMGGEHGEVARSDSAGALTKFNHYVTPRCVGLIRTCRQCGHVFEDDDKSDSCSECGAMRRCRNSAMVGSIYCSQHGGGAPVQARRSLRIRNLPKRLLSHYEDATKDPRLLELIRDIALLDVRIGDLLSRVERGESGQTWRKLQANWRKYEVAVKRGDDDQMAEYFDEIKRLIASGNNDYSAWDDVKDTLDLKRRLVESERKRLMEQRQMIRDEQALAIVVGMVRVINNVIEDMETKAEIQRQIQGVIIDRGGVNRESVRAVDVLNEIGQDLEAQEEALGEQRRLAGAGNRLRGIPNFGGGDGQA